MQEKITCAGWHWTRESGVVIYRPFLCGKYVTTINGISFAWLSEGIQILQNA
jgi:hypothetical protein